MQLEQLSKTTRAKRNTRWMRGKEPGGDQACSTVKRGWGHRAIRHAKKKLIPLHVSYTIKKIVTTLLLPLTVRLPFRCEVLATNVAGVAAVAETGITSLRGSCAGAWLVGPSTLSVAFASFITIMMSSSHRNFLNRFTICRITSTGSQTGNCIGYTEVWRPWGLKSAASPFKISQSSTNGTAKS